MKRIVLCLMLLLGVGFLTSCAPPGHYADPFYNETGDDFPRNHLPIIKPIEATREKSSAPWSVNLMPYGPWVQIPNSQVEYPYSHIEELEKFAVKNGVIMAYSSYVDKQADPYVQQDYYHWFVMVPDQSTTKGFHTESEFLSYVQTLGIQNPVWQTPDETFDKFVQTGCLDWVPDCK